MQKKRKATSVFCSSLASMPGSTAIIAAASAFAAAACAPQARAGHSCAKPAAQRACRCLHDGVLPILQSRKHALKNESFVCHSTATGKGVLSWINCTLPATASCTHVRHGSRSAYAWDTNALPPGLLACFSGAVHACAALQHARSPGGSAYASLASPERLSRRRMHARPGARPRAPARACSGGCAPSSSATSGGAPASAAAAGKPASSSGRVHRPSVCTAATSWCVAVTASSASCHSPRPRLWT